MDQMFQNINSVFLQITLNDQIFKKSQNFNMQISFSAEKQAGKAMYLGSDIVLWAKTDRNEILDEKLSLVARTSGLGPGRPTDGMGICFSLLFSIVQAPPANPFCINDPKLY